MNPTLESWEADAKVLRELYKSILESEGWPSTDLDIDRDILTGYGCSDPATKEEVQELRKKHP